MSCNCGVPATLQGLAGQAEKDQALEKIKSIQVFIDLIDASFPAVKDALRKGNFSWWADNWVSWKAQHAKNVAEVTNKATWAWGWDGWLSGLNQTFQNLTALNDEVLRLSRGAAAPPPAASKPPGTPPKPGAPPPGISPAGPDYSFSGQLISGVPNAALYAGAALILFAIWRSRQE